MFSEILEAVHKTCPLVHNITNYVTVNDVANAVLAVGASPIMADDKDEVEEISALCSALNVNIGTLNRRTIESMFIAARKAASLHKPLVLDPVGAGASKLRTDTAVKLLKAAPFNLVRANMSEVKAITGAGSSTKGVDADVADAVSEAGLDRSVAFAKSFAAQHQCTVAITGAIDLVADEARCFVIRNGVPQMSRITGTGCQLSAIAAAFIASWSSCVEAAAAAVCAMGVAGEVALSRLQPGEGNATLRCRIIDALYCMTGDELERGARYDIR